MSISGGTGGNVFYPQPTDGLLSIATEISSDLRGQYSIGYFSSNTARDGAFRMVEIEPAEKNADDIKIRHRRGYYAPNQ